MMYVYSMGPIDWWGGWGRADTVVSDGPREPFGQEIPRKEYEAALARAEQLARLVGWEGDRSEGPFISALPNPADLDSYLLIAWKQPNNGTTFVSSPIPLPYLEKEGWARATSEDLPKDVLARYFPEWVRNDGNEPGKP